MRALGIEARTATSALSLGGRLRPPRFPQPSQHSPLIRLPHRQTKTPQTQVESWDARRTALPRVYSQPPYRVRRHMGMARSGYSASSTLLAQKLRQPDLHVLDRRNAWLSEARHHLRGCGLTLRPRTRLFSRGDCFANGSSKQQAASSRSDPGLGVELGLPAADGYVCGARIRRSPANRSDEHRCRHGTG